MQNGRNGRRPNVPPRRNDQQEYSDPRTVRRSANGGRGYNDPRDNSRYTPYTDPRMNIGARGNANDPRYNNRGANANDPRYNNRANANDPRYNNRANANDPRYNNRGANANDPRYNNRGNANDPRYNNRGGNANDPRYNNRGGNANDPRYNNRGNANDPRYNNRANANDPRYNNRGANANDPRYNNRGANANDPRYNNRGANANDPRYNNRGGNANDPRYNNRGGNANDPRYNNRGANANDPRYNNRGNSNDPRYNNRGNANDPRYNNGYTKARAAEYINMQREAAYRAEKARRAEYERRRADAMRARKELERQIKEERRQHRRLQFKYFCGRAAVCGVIFVILAAFLASCLFIDFMLAPDAPPSKVKYTYGGELWRTADDSQAMRGGNVYVCFNDVASFLDLAVTGDTESMKFVFADPDSESGSAGDGTEDTIVFMMDSRTVVINSQSMTLPAESFLYGEEVWVSTDFLEDFVEGLSVSVDGKTVAVAGIEDEELSTDKVKVYKDVFLKLKSPAPIPDVDGEHDDEKRPEKIEVEFTADLTEYEKYMSPDSFEEYLMLVNGANVLNGEYVPEDLTDVYATRQDGRETQTLREYAAGALEALFLEMQTAGITDVTVTSAYRSYYTQEYLHNLYIEEEMAADPALTWEEAEAIVLSYSSLPGTSEHQTGLCVDMHNLESADVTFADTEAYRWLSENAWKFGYILRYPEDKTGVTGITFEPWHWRYVGRTAAHAIWEGGLCLEEYEG